VNTEQLDRIAKRTLPTPAYKWLKTQWHVYSVRPPIGMIRWGDMRRLTPINSNWGFDRGLPIDRYYIENFLSDQSHDIRGRVLEIGDAYYTKKFGGDRVTQSDILHVTEGSPDATIIGDLTDADHIPSDTFDCFILTETLQLIYEVRLALKTIYRILKPGGVVLVTVPGITQLSDPQWRDTWYWNFTTRSAQRLFEEIFPPENLTIATYGNVLSATAFLQGVATEELKPEELDYFDPNYEVTITIRAIKPEVTP
jgi:SAM-dependent methyltransferase